MDALRFEELVVKPDRVEALVLVQGSQRNTTPELIERCLVEFPYLGLHACVNGVGPTFAAVMEDTSLPHLLEHMVIEQQTLASDDEEATFLGTTQFTAEDPDVARVSVSFANDVACLAAFTHALEFLNAALAG